MTPSRHELHESDRAQVAAGMDVVGWETPTEQWREHVDREEQALRRTEARVRAWGNIAVVAGSGFGYVLGLALYPSVFVALGVAAALAVLPWWAARTVAGRLTRERGGLFAARTDAPPPVRITSTGVSLGPITRVFVGDRSRLSWAELDSGPPACLLLTFERKVLGVWLGAGTLSLPIPPGMEEDVRDLTEVLEHKAIRMRPPPRTIVPPRG